MLGFWTWFMGSFRKLRNGRTYMTLVEASDDVGAYFRLFRLFGHLGIVVDGLGRGLCDFLLSNLHKVVV